MTESKLESFTAIPEGVPEGIAQHVGEIALLQEVSRIPDGIVILEIGNIDSEITTEHKNQANEEKKILARQQALQQRIESLQQKLQACFEERDELKTKHKESIDSLQQLHSDKEYELHRIQWEKEYEVSKSVDRLIRAALVQQNEKQLDPRAAIYVLGVAKRRHAADDYLEKGKTTLHQYDMLQPGTPVLFYETDWDNKPQTILDGGILAKMPDVELRMHSSHPWADITFNYKNGTKTTYQDDMVLSEEPVVQSRKGMFTHDPAVMESVFNSWFEIKTEHGLSIKTYHLPEIDILSRFMTEIPNLHQAKNMALDDFLKRVSKNPQDLDALSYLKTVRRIDSEIYDRVISSLAAVSAFKEQKVEPRTSQSPRPRNRNPLNYQERAIKSSVMTQIKQFKERQIKEQQKRETARTKQETRRAQKQAASTSRKNTQSGRPETATSKKLASESKSSQPAPRDSDWAGKLVARATLKMQERQLAINIPDEQA